MDSKTRLNKIQEVLEESLNLNWVDKIVYCYQTKMYHSAYKLDFSDGVATYAYLRDNKKNSYLARVIIKGDKFTIQINGVKIDASEHWQELIKEQEQGNEQELVKEPEQVVVPSVK